MITLNDLEINESYGVNLTPHLEKYQNQDDETSSVMQATWNFGNKLKAQGYKVAYMHGPIGLFEGLELKADWFVVDKVEPSKLINEWIRAYPDTSQYLFFLFRVKPGEVNFARIEKAVVDEHRKRFSVYVSKRNQPKRKKKEALDNADKVL